MEHICTRDWDSVDGHRLQFTEGKAYQIENDLKYWVRARGDNGHDQIMTLHYAEVHFRSFKRQDYGYENPYRR